MSDLPRILEVNPNSVTLDVSPKTATLDLFAGPGFVDTISTVATFSALGSAATAGQLKRTADTDSVYVSNGTSWDILGGATFGTDIQSVSTANASGSDQTAARSDHVHSHGNQSGGSLHAAATDSVSGFMSGADKTKLDGFASGAAAVGSSSPTSVTVSASSAGSSNSASKQDHQHFHGNLSGIDGSNNPLHSIPSFAFASLPASPSGDFMARLTDKTRGLVAYRSSQWSEVTPWVNVLDFGAKATPDGSFDNLAAFEAAIASMGVPGLHPSAGTLLVPKPLTEGAYYAFSGPLHITRQLRMVGMGGAIANQFETSVKLVWPAGCNGIVIDFADGGTIDGIGAMLSNLALVSSRAPTWAPGISKANGSVVIPRNRTGYVYVNEGSTGTTGSSEPSWSTTIGGTTSDGTVTWTTRVSSAVQVLATSSVEHCSISDWSGNGIHIEASTPDANANTWLVNHCFIQGCGGSGIYTYGTDANAGHLMNSNLDGNDVYGINEASFLGNSYTANQISSNGWFFGGSGEGFWAGTTNYPTDTFVLPNVRNGYYYIATVGGNSGGSEPTWPTSIGATVSDGAVTWTCFAIYNGGCAKFGGLADVNSSACNGNYIEGYQYPLIVGLNARYDALDNGAGLDPTSTGWYAAGVNSTGLVFRAASGGPTMQVVRDGSNLLKFYPGGDGSSTAEYSLAYADGYWRWRNQDADIYCALSFTTTNARIHNGNVAPVNGTASFARNGFYIGSDTRVLPSNDKPSATGALFGDIAIRNSFQGITQTGAAAWINVDVTSSAEAWAKIAGFLKEPTAKTSDYTLRTEDSGQVFSEFGAVSKVTFHLPTYADRGIANYGWWADFICEQDGVGLRIDAPDRADVIYLGNLVSSTNGYIETTKKGSTCRVLFTRFSDPGTNTIGTFFGMNLTGEWSIG